MKYKKIKDKILTKIFSNIYFDIDYNYENSVFLTGSARSGTTWLSNIINYKNEYRYIFEPFHENYSNFYNGYFCKKYINFNDNNDLKKEKMNSLLIGNVKGQWVDKFNKKFISKKRLIKSIRAHHLLEWLNYNFPKLPIVLMLRHPCAVANSRMKLGWDTPLSDFLNQKKLMEDYLKEFKPYIMEAKTEFEKNIFMWSIQNFLPLKHFKSRDIYICFYENLCINPIDEIKRLFNFLDIEFSKNDILKKVNIPSETSRKDSAIKTDDNLINLWRENFSSIQIKRANEILSLFNLENIYLENSVPNMEYYK